MSGEDGLVPKSLAIIPFPSQKLKGIVKALEIRDLNRRGGAIDSSIAVLFNEANDVIFYKNIDFFEALFDAAASNIIELVETKASRQHIQEALKGFYTRITKTIVDSLDVKKGPRESKRSLLLLFNLVPKDLDRIIEALILGDPVLVTGDKAVVELIIDTLTLFCIDHTPQIVYWTEEYVEGDIIGGPPYLKDLYNKAAIIDLHKGKVFYGNSNNYCKKCLKRARQLDSGQAEQLMNAYFTHFQAAVTDFVDIVTQNNPHQTSLDNFIEKIDEDELDFVENYAASKHPLLFDKIKETSMICRKKMSKIYSGFEKYKW